MIYQLFTTDKFDKSLKKLDKHTQKIIKMWIDKNLVGTSNPRQHGKALIADKSGPWRYRIGDYRIISHIDDKNIIILALSIGHRSEIYKNK